MLNRCEFIGNLGRDPEVRYTQSNSKIVNLSLGVTEKWTNRQTGERQEKTEWIRVSIFNEKIADVAEKYLSKGSRCFISGKMQTRKWQDQNGADKYSTEIVLQNFQGELVLLDKHSSDDGERQEPAQRQPPAGRGRDELEDDIPW